MTKSKMMMSVAAVVALGLAAVPALAKPGMGGMGGAMGPMASFATLDADKDGKVTVAEITAAHEARIVALDSNGDGYVSPDELVGMMLQHRPADAPTPPDADRMMAKMTGKAGQILGSMDANKDGKTSVEEMKLAHDPAQTERMVARFDTDGDGAISQAEFDAAKARMAERMNRKDGKGGHGKDGKGKDGKDGHGKHRGGPDGMRGMQGMSGMGGMQGMSGMGGMQGMGGMAGMPPMNGRGMVSMGCMHGMDAMQGMQGMQGMGGMKGQGRLMPLPGVPAVPGNLTPPAAVGVQPFPVN